MHIVCPHCTTSYAINLATLGAAGRTVRCSRCKEVWLARPEDAIEARARRAALAEASQAATEADAAAEWEALAREEGGDGSPGRRQPLDRGRLAGRRLRTTKPTGKPWPATTRRPKPEAGGASPGSGAVATPARGPAAQQILLQPPDRLRRHGRAGRWRC